MAENRPTDLTMMAIEMLHGHEGHLKEVEYCWITQNGVILKVGFQGHDPFCWDIEEQFTMNMYNPIPYFENVWLKVSHSCFGFPYNIITKGTVITEAQEKILIKLFTARKDKNFDEDNTFHYVSKELAYPEYLTLTDEGNVLLIKDDE